MAETYLPEILQQLLFQAGPGRSLRAYFTLMQLPLEKEHKGHAFTDPTTPSVQDFVIVLHLPLP
jgi:hypothetical protein